MKTGKLTLKKLIRQSLMGMMMLSLLLLTGCGWKEGIVIPSHRVLECPDDKTKPCQVSRDWLLERYETERGLLKQLEECRER
jgi:predicted small lipoprotein YifL|tara:strand:+ start:134 stop:379 length:246 start_codon:yes stop_codon:yes gene_type:complete